MSDSERPLHRFEYDSPNYNLRLVEVQREITRREAAYQELLSLCNSVNIDSVQLNALAKQYGGQGAVIEAIRRYGTDYQLHLVVAAQEKEEASDPNLKTYHDGWLAHREEVVAGREEALQRSKHG